MEDLRIYIYARIIYNWGMQKITVKAKVSAGAKTESIVQVDQNVFKIRVQAPPENGKANIRVGEILAEYFNVPKTSVTLVSGTSSREKIFQIEIGLSQNN